MLSRFGPSTLFATNSTAVFESPIGAAVPDVVLAAPSLIGQCDNLAVDGRLSTGSGGRSFTVEWNITYPPHIHPNSTMALNLTSIVHRASAAGDLFLSIPSDFVPLGRQEMSPLVILA